MRKVKYAGIQMQCSKSVEENIQKADHMVREAAAFGAQIILRSFSKDGIFVRKEIMIIMHMRLHWRKIRQYSIFKRSQRS